MCAIILKVLKENAANSQKMKLQKWKCIDIWKRFSTGKVFKLDFSCIKQVENILIMIILCFFLMHFGCFSSFKAWIKMIKYCWKSTQIFYILRAKIMFIEKMQIKFDQFNRDRDLTNSFFDI
jgi:hypothetical protein